MSALSQGGIQVHTHHPGPREKGGQFRFYPLGARAPEADIPPPADRAGRWGRPFVTAVMAAELAVPAVIGEADVAVNASFHMPAFPTFDERREAPPVLEEYDLFPLLQLRRHLIY